MKKWFVALAALCMLCGLALAETQITLSDAGITAAEGVRVEGTAATIIQSGVYRVSGTLSEGRLVVDAQGEVELILDNAQISCSTEAPLTVLSTEELTLTLAAGSVNALSDLRAAGDDYEYDAALYTKEDMTIAGEGELSIVAQAKHGLECKDRLKIEGGSISILSRGDGLHIKDYLRVEGGEIAVNASGDGVEITSDEEGMGYFEMSGGLVELLAEGDGIKAEGDVRVSGGDLRVEAAEDGVQSGGALEISGGAFDIVTGEGASATATSSYEAFFGYDPFDMDSVMDYYLGNPSQTDDVSRKALKGESVAISGGSLVLDAEEDAVHSNGDLTVSGGAINLQSGDDGLHADGSLTASGGSIWIERSNEGIEGLSVRLGACEIYVVSTDDGVNAAGGSDGEDSGWRGRASDYTEGCDVTILEGALLTIQAGGDGIDANGDICFEGGETTIWGPSSRADGALDAGGEIYMNGGTLICAGGSGMDAYPGEASAQPTLRARFNAALSAGVEVQITNEQGEAVLTFTPETGFSQIIVSSPALTEGAQYALCVGDEQVGTAVVEGAVSSFTGESTDDGAYESRFGGGRRFGGFDGQPSATQAPEAEQEGLERL